MKDRQLQLPSLWTVVALAEILPTSFALNLTFLASLSAAPADPNLELASAAPWVIGGAGYTICLVLAPTAGKHLILTILVARVLLAAPALIKYRILTDEEIDDYKRIPAVFLGIVSAIMLITVSAVAVINAWEYYPLAGIAGAVHDHPAVSALGYDLLIALTSTAAWFILPSGGQKAVKAE